MAKAKNINRGDWISVDGNAVKVTKVEDEGKNARGGQFKISYKGGSKSGMLGRAGDAQVSHLVSPWWWRS